MIKNDLRLFFASFFLSLLLAGWVTVFFMVDSSSSRYENNASPALALSRSSDLRCAFDLLGKEYTLYLDQLNQLEQLRKEYACLLTPRPVRLLEQTYSAGLLAWDRYYHMYKEYVFQQSVAEEHPAIP